MSSVVNCDDAAARSVVVTVVVSVQVLDDAVWLGLLKIAISPLDAGDAEGVSEFRSRSISADTTIDVPPKKRKSVHV